ncbi:MAG: FHA domain-containing protein [Myxococcota bacterium]|nr:FHA domain-containing protein [Myxococcota bacterium]
MQVGLELVIRRDGHPDERVVLESGVMVLGRAEDVDLCLPDIGVSRRHARLVVDTQGVTYEDLGSGNGSWFMGKRVRTQTVVAGDEIVIEPFHLHFVEARPVGGMPLAPVATDPGMVTASLVVLSGTRPTPGSRIEIPLDGLNIGRSEREDLTLADASASRHHAEIRRVGLDHHLRDPGSANGVFVNGKRISEHLLQDGDLLRIGDTELRFEALGRRPEPLNVPDEQDYSDRTEAFDKDLAAKLLAEEEAAAEEEARRLEQERAARREAARHLQSQPTLQQPPPEPAPAPAVAPPPPAAAPPPPPAAEPGPGGLGTPNLGAPAFGAPGQGGFGAPPADGPAFGGASGGPGGAKAPAPTKKGSFLSRPINLISVGLLGLSLVAVVAKSAMDSAPEGPEGPAAVSTSSFTSLDLSESDAALVAELMEDGMERFTAEDYTGASGKFLKVLQLDPGNPDAERMGYMACEFIAVQALQDGVERQAASETQRAQAKTEALALAEQAQRGEVPLSEAQKAVRAALNLNPEDAELDEADKQLRRRTARVVEAKQTKQVAGLTEDLSGAYDSAKASLDAGRYAEAVSGFRAILAKDPGGQTPYAAKAKTGLSQAQAKQRELAEGPYMKGMEAAASGDMVGARRQLREALRYDPGHAGASAKLSEIDGELRRAAMDKFHEGKTYEKANQTDKALSAYAECQRLLGDRSSDLHKSAQARIDALLQ